MADDVIRSDRRPAELVMSEHAKESQVGVSPCYLVHSIVLVPRM